MFLIFSSNESIPFRVYQENGDYQVKEEHGVTRTYVELERANNIAKIFTVMALSFHALLEGMAVGLENNSTDIWIMFLGLLGVYSLLLKKINDIKDMTEGHLLH